MTIEIYDTSATDVDELRKLKGETTVSVCLPARDEAATVGRIVEVIVDELMGSDGAALVDELIVIDDASADETTKVASAQGAEVVSIHSILPELGAGHGKGNVLWRSLAASTGDIVVWCDADVTSFRSSYVTRLLTPLLSEDRIDFVKGYYARPPDPNGDGGGRVTELVARPLLSRFFPELATLRQPLAGEVAARRVILERLPFVQGYGVEIGLLIDVLAAAGPDRMMQVDLGVRRHRHRRLEELAVQATEIMHVLLDRAGISLDRAGVSPASLGNVTELARGDGSTVTVTVTEWPPLIDMVGAVNPAG